MKTQNVKYLTIRPEVAGSFGDYTIMDTKTHPPKIERLHYVFEGWLGDDIVEGFPVFLISKNLYELLKKTNFTGYKVDSCRVTMSQNFVEFYSHKKLPPFYWFKITGKKRESDFWVSEKNDLMASEKAIETLKQANINHCDIENL